MKIKLTHIPRIQTTSNEIGQPCDELRPQQTEFDEYAKLKLGAYSIEKTSVDSRS